MSLFWLKWLAIISFLSFSTLPILGLGLGFAPSPSPSSTPHQNLTNSLYIVVASALNRTTDALARISLTESSDVRERAALSDCLEFYNLTISHLNKSLNPNPGSTPFDVQIWLSAAKTNLDNCKASMTEQNVTHPTFLYNHASDLISKGLAINSEVMEGSPRVDHPSWLLDGDVMRLPELAKDSGDEVVVVQDGSGSFRTINEALKGYGRRKSMGRYLIHVKQGTYFENIEIGRKMKDVELVGDGIGKTIVTGNRCVRSGFSIVESATVSKYILSPSLVRSCICFRLDIRVTSGISK